MAIHTDHLRTLAMASRYGISHVAANADSKFLLQAAIAIVEVEKILLEEAEKAKAQKPDSATQTDHA